MKKLRKINYIKKRWKEVYHKAIYFECFFNKYHEMFKKDDFSLDEEETNYFYRIFKREEETLKIPLRKRKRQRMKR